LAKRLSNVKVPPTLGTMFPGTHAASHPEKAAVVMARSGTAVSYADLDRRSCRLANFWHGRGLAEGDAVAICMENQRRSFEVFWAAQRSGLYYTPVNARLTPEEARYIVADSGATAVVVSEARSDLIPAFSDLDNVTVRLLVDGGDSRAFASDAQPTREAPIGWQDYETALSTQLEVPVHAALEGSEMLYSSGTTGVPKGVRRPLRHLPVGTADNAVFLLHDVIGCDSDTVFLSTAPLHHGAPLILSMAVHRLGGTVVVMEGFDAEESLSLIERLGVTHSQWVPTMFVRLLKLPEDVRSRYDLARHRTAIHGAGPCPIEVKRRMIEWWGPILFDYYSGTEGVGTCCITSEEWLAHPGSVGRPVIGEIHVVDEKERPCRTGQVGTVYFSGGPTFEYHNDSEKTASVTTEAGWATLGDLGYVDTEGYLYLTGRKAFTIISGGVNIYPQEIEDTLILHPSVRDVAVFGVPDDDLGETAKAVVEPVPPTVAGPELEQALIAYCRERLASYKCPRSVDFLETLPRDETGKLRKADLRDMYWDGRSSRIV